MTDAICELCQTSSGKVLVASRNWRIVDAAEPNFPGFTRVIWTSHIKEMTDLSAAERMELLDVVFRVESVMRESLTPDKINLASLGNQVPHLHWHVIPRWHDDVAFPAPVWATPGVDTHKAILAGQRTAAVVRRLPDYHHALINEFNRTQ